MEPKENGILISAIFDLFFSDAYAIVKYSYEMCQMCTL